MKRQKRYESSNVHGRTKHNLAHGDGFDNQLIFQSEPILAAVPAVIAWALIGQGFSGLLLQGAYARTGHADSRMRLALLHYIWSGWSR